jgi:hypothetical protein
VAPVHHHPPHDAGSPGRANRPGPRRSVRISYAKVAEYQRRGVVHFHVYYQRQPTDDPDATDWLTGQKLTYDVEHSNTLIFLSADGKQRYIVDAAADTGDNRPPSALIRFMTPQGRHNLYHPSPGVSWTVPRAMQVLSWLAGRTIATGSS